MKTDPQITAMRELASAADVVTYFAGGDCANAIVSMLDHLIETYKIDLMNVSPEGLTRLQAAIQQTLAIRDVVANGTKAIPKI